MGGGRWEGKVKVGGGKWEGVNGRGESGRGNGNGEEGCEGEVGREEEQT